MDIEKTAKTYSFSFTPDDPEKLKQLFDRLRRNASVIEIKTKSETEEPDRIIFNGSSYSKRNECKRMPDYSGSYVTVHKVFDNGGTFSQDFPYFQCSRCGCYVMDNAAFCPACGAEVVDDANA